MLNYIASSDLPTISETVVIHARHPSKARFYDWTVQRLKTSQTTEHLLTIPPVILHSRRFNNRSHILRTTFPHCHHTFTNWHHTLTKRQSLFHKLNLLNKSHAHDTFTHALIHTPSHCHKLQSWTHTPLSRHVLPNESHMFTIYVPPWLTMITTIKSQQV